MQGRKLLTFLQQELSLGDDVTSASAEYLFETPLAASLTGLQQVVDADSVVDVESWKTWHDMRRKAKDLDEAKCDKLLDLYTEDDPEEDDDDDITFLEELLIEEQRTCETLDSHIAETKARIDQWITQDVEAIDAYDDLQRDENDSVKISFLNISNFTRGIHDYIAPSALLAFADLDGYLTKEDEFTSNLTKLSKLLLSTERRKLLEAALKAPVDTLGLTRSENEELKSRYYKVTYDFIRSKCKRKFFETLLKSDDVGGRALDTSSSSSNSTITFSSFDTDIDESLKTLEPILDAAKHSFVSCKDSSDLELQLARLEHFVDAKCQIQEWILNQFSRLQVLINLLQCEAVNEEKFRDFMMQSKRELDRVAAERATTEFSLELILSFANAPSLTTSLTNPLSEALAAITALVNDDLPPLVGGGDDDDDHPEMTDKEAIEYLHALWSTRESRCDADAAAWEENLKSFGSELVRLAGRVEAEARALTTPPHAVELRRLKDQIGMASKTVTRSIDRENRASKQPVVGSVAASLAKAPIYFFIDPAKFRELVLKLKSV